MTEILAGQLPLLELARLCDWCSEPIPAGARADAEVCGVVCRKRRWRWRHACADGRGDRHGTRPADPARAARDASEILAGPMRFAYADPPYPGKAHLYPEREEVDHQALVGALLETSPHGWALSTSAAALRDVLPMCPEGTRVNVWRRQHRPGRSARALNAWEPLLTYGGRPGPTDRQQDLVDVLDYRGRFDAFPGALIGMKPPQFAIWLFRLLGARPGDELVDVFPGSGAIARAWTEYSRDG